jgi:hypothetical protein
MQDAVMVNKQLLQPSFNPTVLAERDCPKAVALSALRGKERVREVWHFSSKFEVLVLTGKVEKKQGKVEGQVGTRCIRQLSRLSGRHRASVGGIGPLP